MDKIAVLGGGSWGMALAWLLDNNGHEVTLWEGLLENYNILSQKRGNPNFLKNLVLDESINITNKLKDITDCSIVLAVVPTEYLRVTLENAAPYLQDQYLVFCNKGIESSSLMEATDVAEDVLGGYAADKMAVLSGPSHAEEVVANVPTAVVIASESHETAEYLQGLFINDNFRVYYDKDVRGVQIGGSLKNVIAIAAGIVDGLGLGDNTKAALVTRGLAEIIRLGKKMGAQPDTLFGLAGMGDLFVTCLSRHSRNRYVGEQIGKGRKLKEILEEMAMVAEGVITCKSAWELSRKHDVVMPITNEVYDILYKDKEPKGAIRDLMLRKPQPETNWG